MSTRRRWLGAAASLAMLGAIDGRRAIAAGVEERSAALATFDVIDIDLPADVRVIVGKPPGIRIRAEAKVLPKIRYEVSRNTLRLSAGGSFSTDQPLEIEISAPRLQALSQRSAASITVDEVDGESLRLTNEGSGEISIESANLQSLEVEVQESGTVTIAGKSTRQRIQATGSSTYDGADLQSETAQVRVSDAATAIVMATGRLDAKVTDAGSIEYLGDPSITQEVDAAGTLQRH